MWCPHCKGIHPCYSRNPSEVGESGGHRFEMIDADDVQYFRRFRECQNCFNVFETSEVNSHFLDELVELRHALSEIRNNAVAYEADAKAAARGLKKLSKSLSKLRALK
jgi:hypothetical protein